MVFSLDKVAVWSRSFSEYEKIFSIEDRDFNKKILGCADGAASFNVEGRAKGVNITSCDPLYGLSVEKIENRISESETEVFKNILALRENYIWSHFKDPYDLRDKRRLAARKFLEDFSKNQSPFYINALLPDLPFEDGEFDLALCGNFLFLYSELLNFKFHLESILELLRVANEVRIFPLIGLDRKEPKQLTNVLNYLQKNSVLYEIIDIDYHFTKGANKMLRIFKAK